MRREPFRPGNEISQSYNDGLVSIYSVTDSAVPGYQPRKRLTFQFRLAYEELRMGLTRYRIMLEDNVRVERVLRVQRAGSISPQDIAVLEDGRQYKIEMTQTVEGVWPLSVDLTLSEVVQKYDVSDLDTSGEAST